MADAAMSEGIPDLRIDRDRPRLRRRRLWLALGGLCALLVAGLVLHLIGRPPSVAVAQVRLSRPGEAATTLTASGYVASDRRSILAPKIPGRLDRLYVQEGQRVQKGEVIARLDDADARVGVERAQAQAAEATAQRAQAHARRVQADQRLGRARRLFQGGVIPQAELEDARAEGRAAVANEQAAEAGVRAAQRQVALARLQLQYTVVRAPFTGTVARKLADEGAVLAPAAIDQPDVGGIVELVDLGALEVDAEVSEDQLRKVRLGQPALVTLDAFPDQVYRAKVSRIRPAIDRSKGTAVIKVAFDQPPAHVLPDMSAKVAFLDHPVDASALAPRLRVPASAVVTGDGGAAVWIVQDGRARRLPVQVLQRTGSEVELSSGPPAGAQVIVSPGKGLSPGQAVRVQS